MPAPLSNLIRAIEAPVASSRQSIFSCTPLSDFSRHGIDSDWTRISSSLGAPSGSMVRPRMIVGKAEPQSPVRADACAGRASFRLDVGALRGVFPVADFGRDQRFELLGAASGGVGA